MTTPFSMQAGRWLRTRAGHAVLLGGWGLASVQGAEPFRLFTRPLVIPERGAVTSYVLETAPERYGFLPPADWVVQENATTREVVMMAPSLTTSIRFKIVPADPESPDDPGTETWRNAILEPYPGARVVGEFPCYTGSGAGTAFDLERTAAERLKISTRLAVIPLAEGRVEFNLTTPAGTLAEYHLAFGNLLTSFTVEPARAKQTGTNLPHTPMKHDAQSHRPDPRSTAEDEPGRRAGGTTVAADPTQVTRPSHSP